MIWLTEELILADGNIITIEGTLSNVGQKYIANIDAIVSDIKYNLFNHIIISRESDPEPEDVHSKYFGKIKKIRSRISKISLSDIPSKLPIIK